MYWFVTIYWKLSKTVSNKKMQKKSFVSFEKNACWKKTQSVEFLKKMDKNQKKNVPKKRQKWIFLYGTPYRIIQKRGFLSVFFSNFIFLEIFRKFQNFIVSTLYYIICFYSIICKVFCIKHYIFSSREIYFFLLFFW